MTTREDEMVAKLLRREDGYPQTGRGSIDATGKGTIEMDPAPQVLVNPDGPQAADLITALSSERDLLREALEQIAGETGKGADGFIDWQRCVDRIQEIARKAITGVTGG